MSALADTLIEAGLRHRLVAVRTLAGWPGEARRYGLELYHLLITLYIPSPL